MSLKDNLKEELQKLRLSREKPRCLQEKDWAKKTKTKKSKLLEDAKSLLDGLEEG